MVTHAQALRDTRARRLGGPGLYPLARGIARSAVRHDAEGGLDVLSSARGRLCARVYALETCHPFKARSSSATKADAPATHVNKAAAAHPRRATRRPSPTSSSRGAAQPLHSKANPRAPHHAAGAAGGDRGTPCSACQHLSMPSDVGRSGITQHSSHCVSWGPHGARRDDRRASPSSLEHDVERWNGACERFVAVRANTPPCLVQTRLEKLAKTR